MRCQTTYETPFPATFPLFSCVGIWSRPVSEEDLLKWESLVIGPALSPYAYGFFTFRMQVAQVFIA